MTTDRPRGRVRRGARALYPGLWLVGVMVLLSLAERRGLAVGMPRAIVDAAAVAFFLVLIGAPLVLYPIARSSGWGWKARVAASLVPAAWWWLTEVAFRVGQGHTLAQAVALNLFINHYLLAQLLAIEMVVAEIGCRVVARLRKGTVRIASVGLAFATVGTLAWFVSDAAVLAPYYLGFQRTYRRLFLEGQLPKPPKHPGPLESALAQGDGHRPNIVVILSDDHRWDTMSAAGHPFVETPSLDRIAAEGVRFRNAFVTSSLCSPSRASFLTGQYPERHGVFNNFTAWDDSNRTFFEYLKAAGYDTAFIGKWHMPGPLPKLRGVDTFVTFTAMGGQGQYFDCPLVVDGREEPSRKRYITEELTERAIEWIRSRREAPFALYLSHKSVHLPFSPDPREAGRYARAPVQLPPEAHSWVGYTEGQYVHLATAPLEASLRQYAEAVASMDREIGRLLDALDEKGVARDTLLVYTSDNGYLWGEHRLIDKRWAYEESIRIPFLVRYPARVPVGGVSLDPLVLNIDLAPTLVDLAGIAPPAYMQGRSLLPLLDDERAPWRDAFYYGYYFEPPFPVPTLHALRTGRYEYVEYEGRPPELFDLDTDPRELRNLAGSEATVGEEGLLRARLAALRRAAETGARE
jgi:arylsulfatase A-like enzyme